MARFQVNVYVAVSITWATALVALIFRFIARRMTKQSWWTDDYFCLAAFVFASGFNTVTIIWLARWFLGRIIDPSYTEEQRENVNVNARLLMLCCEYCYTLSIACTKFAILTLYWRLFQHSSIRIPIQIIFGISGAWLILRTFMISFQCLPLAYFWDKSINGHCPINESQFFFATTLTHAILDLAILALPVIEVSRLKLRIGQKVAVIGLFFIGIVVCLASIFNCIESIKYPSTSTEIPLDVAPSCMWGNVELNIAIVSACVPLLRPVFRIILPQSILSSYGESNHAISRGTLNRTHTTHPIRLTTITKTKAREADESSSTHQLADLEQVATQQHDFDRDHETI